MVRFALFQQVINDKVGGVGSHDLNNFPTKRPISGPVSRGETVNKMISSEFLFKTINQAGKTRRLTRVLFMK
jgi:hypothetical protein